MSKLYLADPSGYDVKMNEIARHFSHKVEVYPPGSCPITMQISMLRTAANQTCGKCVPCRDGLPLVARLMQKVLDGRATEKTLDNIRMMATMIRSSADCAIGWNAADEVLKGLDLFADEYKSHIENKKCLESIGQKVPCISLCPAHVNIPGYIALVGEEDYAGAINLIRKDNPFPTACAMVCEHPCEERCRRKMLESPINIRALKKYAVDMMPVDKVATPKPNPSTGKSIGVIGGGPAGLTAAYFLALMGHKIEVYETHDKLGGMLRYGIPNYRFPKDRLDEDIRAILNSGDIHVTYNTTIGKDIPVKDIYEKHDAIFVGIGAQTGKTLRIEGADAGNVVSAVDILDQIGNGNLPDYTGKNVVVIGGGPGGMEAARVAALKGNHVTLYERNELGGTLNLPAQAQFKTRLKALIEYYKTQMRKLGVTVVHQEIDIDSPVLAAADKIIAATGAHSVVPPIPGAHGANVIDIKDAHRDPAAIKGKKIAICGGGLSGSDFALEMATEYGKQCTIIEMKPDVAMDMVFINQHSLKIYLKDAGVVTRTNTRVSEIVENGVRVINEHGEQELIEADVVVAAFGMVPNTELTNALKQKYNKKLVCVGDCVEVGKSGKAIRGGFYAGMQID